jgi:hypothetical protein
LSLADGEGQQPERARYSTEKATLLLTFYLEHDRVTLASRSHDIGLIRIPQEIGIAKTLKREPNVYSRDILNDFRNFLAGKRLPHGFWVKGEEEGFTCGRFHPPSRHDGPALN